MVAGRVWYDKTVDWMNVREDLREFKLHDLQLRALENRQHVPSVVEGNEWLVVTFMTPVVSKGSFRLEQLTVLVGKEQAITVHGATFPYMKAIVERVDAHQKLAASPSGILAIIADVVTEKFLPLLDTIDEKVDAIEDIIVKEPNDTHLQQLFSFKKTLVHLRRVVIPTTIVLDSLSNERFELVDKNQTRLLRDTYTSLWRTHELIDAQRDLVSSALETYLSVVSNRLNDVMKRLTIISSIFLPISFLVGFGGMNFVKEIPFDSHLLFATVMILIVGTPIAMFLYYKRKRWL